MNETKVAALTKPPFVHRAKIASDGTPSVLSAVATLDDGSRAEDVVFLNSSGLTESLDVHLVELYTAVVDQKEAPVHSLTRNDFAVLENGKPQPIERFKETTSDPMTIGLAIDSSESMKEEIIDLQETASLFLQMALAYEGRAFLIDFDSELRLRQSTTSDLKALQKSAQHLTADGGTALYDAIVFGLLQFQGVSGKKALVVLTDGHDQISRYDYDAVIGVAKESGVPVFIIVLDTETRAYISSAGLMSGGNRPLVLLQKIADQTGGKAYHLRSPEGLVKVYEEIDKELRSQYLLTYRPSGGMSGGWRDVDVRVKKKGLRARAVAGYYAEE